MRGGVPCAFARLRDRPCGSRERPGFVEVIRQTDADHYEKIASYPTGWGALTGWFVPEWSKLIIATRRQDATHPGEILLYDAQ